jgi:hypothetical protein
VKDRKNPRIVVNEMIDKSMAWAYFDGATQHKPLVGGVEEVLLLFDSIFIKFK